MYHYKMCGLDNVYLLNGYQEIESAEGKAVAINNPDRLHQLIAEKITNLPRILNGKEFRFLRSELDMSQKAIGLLMGKKDQSIAKWEKGEQPVPKLADAAIRKLYIESIGKNSQLREILDKYNALDRNRQESQMKFQESGDGWHTAA